MSEIVLPATIAEAIAAHTYLARVAAGCLRREVVVHGDAGFAVGDAVEVALRGPAKCLAGGLHEGDSLWQP